MLNKEQLNSLLNFSILLVIILVVIFLLFTQINRKTVIDDLQTAIDQETPVTKTTLTEEEVDIERVKIIKVTPTTEEIKSLDVSTANTISEDEAKNYVQSETNIPVYTQQQYGEGLVAVPVNLSNYTNDISTKQSVDAYVKPGSGIEIASASVSTASQENELISNVILEGTVFSINTKEMTVGLIEGQNPPVSIKIKSDTEIKINNKFMTISGIKVGDIFRVIGTKPENSTVITAQSLELVGAYQIIP